MIINERRFSEQEQVAHISVYISSETRIFECMVGGRCL